MANVILFHSVLGLRETERHFAAGLSAAGHPVTLPDLYGGTATDNIEEGFDIKQRIGWDAICDKAREALATIPDDAVLAGISMGAGVVARMWSVRPAASRILLLHGLAEVPANARAGIPVQLHLSNTDRFFPEPEIDAWRDTVRAAGADAQVFRYASSGHYFSDPTSADYNSAAAATLWERILEFLG